MQGILPPKPPSPTAFIEEALADARRIAHENRLEQASIDALAKLEDDEDEAFLAHYRDKRLRELATIAATSLHGSVYSIQRPDYARDVTEASHDGWVLVLLTSPQGENTESRLAEEAWLELSHRWCDLKFCQMRADLCIEGYPEKNTPTVLVYRNGDIKKQLITFKELQGEGTTVASRLRLPSLVLAPAHSFRYRKAFNGLGRNWPR